MNSYFSHDSNARNDEKLIRLRMKHGAEGYGVYFMILERLRDEADYMSVKDYNVIAFDLRVDANLIKDIVENFGLFAFTDDGKCFYSESFNKRMSLKDEAKQKRAQAGKKGAKKRWNNKSDDDNSNENNSVIAKPLENDSNAMAMPSQNDSKESKVNKNKVNKNKAVAKGASAPATATPLQELSEFYQRNFGLTNPTIEQDLEYSLDDFDGNVEIVEEAMKRAARDQKGFRYALGIMKKWLAKNINTMEQVKAEDVQFENNQANKFGNNKPQKSIGVTPAWLTNKADEQANDSNVSKQEIADKLANLASLGKESE